MGKAFWSVLESLIRMASKVDVMLLEDVANLGLSGELTEVKRGYARNCLLPKGLAVMADASTLRAYAKRKAKLEAAFAQRKAEAEEIRERLQSNFDNSRTIVIQSRAGDSGKLFGSISKDQLAQAISDQFSIDILKTQIISKDSIRNLGEYEIKVQLLSGMEALVKVRIEAS